jgi:hypothetical protein
MCGREPADLVRLDGHAQHAGLLPLAVQPQAGDVCGEAGEVLRRQFLQFVELVGPPLPAVLGAVGD